VLTIEYAEGTKLHVPVSQTHLLSRYVGVSKHQVHLHRLGGKRWNSEKENAERAIVDLASSLLETQAQRNILNGYSFPADTPWQHDLEAAFPYQETPDQQKVIVEVKTDMESSKPMDRLICGDAGYGKTEVAMRAAFKTVMAGKQVAVLVPTTVLAQQHFETFKERMSAYPVRIEMLSRFVTHSRQIGILKSLAAGTLDIVIGTHALVQPGIRFRDLGLVIIDEEQRFGVAHKERLKELRRLVDVLTLTATPIPRTLYMSLTGARDMSLLQTPPRERLAIETLVAPNTDKVVREAILREINREGQVFYLHNRVMTIEMVKKRLERVIPEARMEIAHGQMAASELSSVMKRFVAGEFEVLICTTIIESGMDIPRANTILIDRADRFGIADLYQLRGRVGRSRHKAYAYLLLPSHGQVDSDARRRISAVKKYSSLSAGFNLALRDLELRGAGNLLGTAQSGHITAIGFGLYCQLLKASVARLKGQPVPPVIDVEVQLDFISLSPDASTPDNSAIIPYAYIEDERLRIAVYRKLAEMTSPEEATELEAELQDRYGAVPPPVRRLLKIAELRTVGALHGIRQIEAKEGKIMLMRDGDYLMDGKRFPRLTASTPDKQLDEVIALTKTVDRWTNRREHPDRKR
jgi:transcription-repair coupling factor (superfamily II helicase)